MPWLILAAACHFPSVSVLLGGLLEPQIILEGYLGLRMLKKDHTPSEIEIAVGVGGWGLRLQLIVPELPSRFLTPIVLW